MTQHPRPFGQTVQGRCPTCRGESLFLGEGGYVTCARLDCTNPSAATDLLERQQQPADPARRHTADTITDDELDSLYAVSEWWKQAYLAARDGEDKRTAERDRLSSELAALKSIGRGYCPECGRGDCSPTADQWYEQQQRAERAVAAIERVQDAAALHRQGLIRSSELHAVIGAALDERTKQT